MAEFEFFADPGRFRDAVTELVARDPVGATMLSGVLAGHLTAPAPGAAPLMGCLRDGDGATVAVLRTPPYPMLVVVDPARADVGAALRVTARAVLDRGERVVGFHGRRSAVLDLAAAWSECTGVTPQPRMWSLYYRLAELVPPAPVPGKPQVLTPDDPAEVHLLADWLTRFEREAGVARDGHVPDAEFVQQGVRRGMVFTWWTLDASPVAVAGHSAVRADGGCRIAPVYTPPDRRRQRFGAAATVAAVRSARASGATEVTLFTDQDYAPANELYRSLGFAPIAEFAEFDLPSSG